MKHDELEYYNEPKITSLERKGNSLIFETVTLTDKYVPTNVLKENYNTIENKEMRWRHLPPEENASSFIGVVKNARLEEITDKSGDKVTALITKNEIFGNTKSQKKAQSLIEKCYENGEGVCGVSAGFVKLSDDDGNVVGMHIRELSLTPRPKCKECGVLTPEGVVLEMTDKLKEHYKPDIGDSQKPKGHMEGGQKTSSAKSDVGSGVNEESGKQKNKKKKLKPSSYGMEDDESLHGAIGVYEKMNKVLENRNIELEVLSEELVSRVESYESKIKQLEDLLVQSTAYIEELEDKNEKLATIPLRMRIAELKGLEDPEEIKEVLERYEDRSFDYLVDIVEELEDLKSEGQDKIIAEEYEEKQPDKQVAIAMEEEQVVQFEDLTDPNDILKHAGFSEYEIQQISRGASVR
ncbi:MAG: hypothetical protein ACTSRA_00305 [Promethearchaeota archaeon]|nr:MAG: hypothetical protein [Helarchaeota virus Nidhogg Meg22_1012]URC17396.1 MAG: hypothetical protein [Helarchaeota virus Nidhogg Meg22_1214]